MILEGGLWRRRRGGGVASFRTLRKPKIQKKCTSPPPLGRGEGSSWWHKMPELGANPPTHLCTQAPQHP